MTMITPQRLAHERLPAGHVLALELLQGTGAVVQLSHAGRVVESVQISASRSFGPYMHDMTAAVSCFAGSLVGATVSADTAPGLSASQRAGSASLVSWDGIPGAAQIIAHRSGAMVYPEGSFLGIQAAYAAGIRRFEVDCQMTYDGKVTASIHDETVQRTCTYGTASGATTNAAGYASGVGTVTLASAGTGSINVGDVVQFGSDTTPYTVTSGDADVSGGGSISFTPNLVTAIPASATAIAVGQVAALTAAQYKALRLSPMTGVAAGLESEAPMLLSELLEWATGKNVELILEAKSPGGGNTMAAIMGELKIRAWPRDRVILACFVGSVAQQAAAAGWRAITYFSSGYTTADIDTAQSTGMYAVAFPYASWTAPLVTYAKARNLYTMAYTANRYKYVQDVMALGVDAVITDDPAYMQQQMFSTQRPPLTRDVWHMRRFTPGHIGTSSVDPAFGDTQRGQFFSNGNWGVITGGTFVGCLQGINCPLGGNPSSRSGRLKVKFTARTRVANTSWAGFQFGLIDDSRNQEAVVAPAGAFQVIYRQNRQVIIYTVNTSGAATAIGTSSTGTDLVVGTEYWMEVVWSDNGNGTSTITATLYDTDGTTALMTQAVAAAPQVAGGYFAIARKDIQLECIPGTLTATA